MWGFSDLAKKAQELSEQTTGGGSLFNLDSMQGGSGKDEDDSNKDQANEANAAAAQSATAQTAAQSATAQSAQTSIFDSAAASTSTYFGSPSVATNTNSISAFFSTPEPIQKQESVSTVKSTSQSTSTSQSQSTSTSLFGSMPLSFDQPASVPASAPVPELAVIAPKSEPPVKSMSMTTTLHVNVQQVDPSLDPKEVLLAKTTDNGNNEWDNDWDFDEQAVNTAPESMPIITTAPMMMTTTTTTTSPLLIQQAREAPELTETENSEQQQLELPIEKLSLLEDPVIDIDQTPVVVPPIESAPEMEIMSPPPSPTPPDEVAIPVKHALEPPPEVTQKEVENDWKEDDLDDMYDDDDDDDDDNDDDDDEQSESEEEMTEATPKPLESETAEAPALLLLMDPVPLDDEAPIQFLPPDRRAEDPHLVDQNEATDEVVATPVLPNDLLIPVPTPTLFDLQHQEFHVGPTPEPAFSATLDDPLSAMPAAPPDPFNLMQMTPAADTSSDTLVATNPVSDPSTESDLLAFTDHANANDRISNMETATPELVVYDSPVVDPLSDPSIAATNFLAVMPKMVDNASPAVDQSLHDEIATVLDDHHQTQTEQAEFDADSLLEQALADDKPGQAGFDPFSQFDDALADDQSGPAAPLVDDRPGQVRKDDQPEQVRKDDQPEQALVDDQPKQAMVDDQSEENLVDDQPDKAMVDDQPEENLVDDQPKEALVDDQSEEAMMDEHPEEAMVDDQSEEAPADDQPEEAMVDDQSEEDLVDDQSEEALADDQSEEALADDQSEEALADDQPEEAMVDDQSEEAMADDQSEEAMVDDQPEEAMVDDQPEEALADEQSEEALADDQPEEALVDEQSEEALADDQPEDALADDQSEEAMVDEQSEEALVADQPEQALVADHYEQALMGDHRQEAPESAQEEALADDQPEQTLGSAQEESLVEVQTKEALEGAQKELLVDEQARPEKDMHEVPGREEAAFVQPLLPDQIAAMIANAGVKQETMNDPFGFSSAVEEDATAATEENNAVDERDTEAAVEVVETPQLLSVDTPATDEDAAPVDLAISDEPSERMIPASVLDQFTHQMQRLEEHHHAEVQEVQRVHAQEMEKVRNSFTHDGCEVERSQLEKRFVSKLREKDEQLQEVMHVNEGMKLKMEVLKREVDGTQQLLEGRDSEFESFNAAREHEKKMLEKKLKSMKDTAGTAQADIFQIQAQLVSTQAELEQSNDAYGALKSRVKIVATELKDRRAECRSLAQNNVELTDTNEQLQTQLTHVESQFDDQNRSGVEKGEEMSELRDKVKKLEEELREAEKKLQDRGVVGEKALSAYKKKAQNSLAVANARAAAAMQAREEAELEARAARSTADVAVERAQKAEAKGNDALEEAKGYVKEMEREKAEVEGKANEAINLFSKTQADLEEAQSDVLTARTARDKMAKELTLLNHEFEVEKSKTAELQRDLADVQQRSNDLYNEVETLRDELRKSATAAFMAQNNDGSGASTNGGMGASSTRFSTTNGVEKSESEANILMLQRELQDSDQAIKELKETLRSTLENQGQNGKATTASRPNSAEANSSSASNSGNDSTPLFYAMEKQAELNQARAEINRLATLLGELQSEKRQAYDAVEDMKHQKEDAESRLARFEKLGPSGGSKRTSSTRVGTNMHSGYGAKSVDSTDSMNDPNSAGINLEYLKNVMVSYLKAKTLKERKRLLPAVSAVLCLTQEEAAAAMKSVEESGSVESVGMSLFEGLKLM